MDRDQILDRWLDFGVLYIERLEEIELNNQVRLDYSLDSLRAVEAAALSRLPDAGAALDEDDDRFVCGIVGYVGEALQRAAGGHWEWRSAAEPVSPAVTDKLLVERLARYQWHFDEAAVGGFVVAVADDALQLEPVSPLHLLLVLLTERATGEGVISRTWRAWQTAAKRYAAEHPGWQPTKAYNLADGLYVPPPSDVLNNWLATQADRFPRWAARWPGQWDFSAESVDRLAALVFETTPTVAELQNPANRDFVDGATWYLGEALRRACRAEWVYHEWAGQESDPDLIRFIVLGEDYTAPFSVLRYAVRTGQTGHVRAFYDRWSEE